MEKYIGIENEVISFKKGRKVKFGKYFKRFRKPSDLQITRKENIFGIRAETSVATEDGLSFYVDGRELEILTPPVALNKGFATRLTDLLMLGRDRTVNSIPELLHTGYSMHWNITKGKPSYQDFYEGIAIPFQLFGLTPLSCGFRLRKRGRKKELGRYELLGDSLTNEEQIRATALLLGSYAYAIEAKESNPLKVVGHKFKPNYSTSLFLPNGRYDEVKIEHAQTKFEGKIQAQQYLELFYQWIEPFVKELGTKEEAQNLEDFISGRKKLEFDKFKYFAYLYDMDGNKTGEYQPIKTKDPDNSYQILKASERKIDIPLEGKLLGELIKRKKDQIELLKWEELWLEDEVIKGIGNMYKYASNLDPNLPRFEEAVDINLMPSKVESIMPNPNLSYNPDDDEFNDPRKSVSGYVLRQMIKETPRKLRNFLILTGIGLASLAATCMIYQYIETISRAETIIQKYGIEKVENKEQGKSSQERNLEEWKKFQDTTLRNLQ